MNNYDPAHEAAIDRDLRDSERLEHFVHVIHTALDAVARDAYPLEHPHARWQPGDLIDALQGELISIRHEIHRMTTGPVVVEAE